MATVAADIGIWDVDVQSGSLHWCPRCAKIFGEPLGPGGWQERLLERVHPGDRGGLETSIANALRPTGTGIFDAEYRILKSHDEQRWLSINGKVFFENVSGRRTAIRFLGTMLDRTTQKLAEQALVEAEKLAITGRLAVSIAHEIKNPIESVSNLLYLVRHEPAAEQRAEYLSLAGAELTRLDDIVTNTLRFYRNPVEAVTVDIGDLIAMVTALFRGRIDAQQVRVQTEIAPGIVASAPQGELRQVLANLVGNALDAMPAGGRLLIRARALNSKHPKRIRLTVADTGMGMTREVQTKVFDLFYTTKKVNGTGVGLWLSHEIVKKLGSQLRVKSAIGRGTVFRFCLSGAKDSSPARVGSANAA